MAKTKSNPDGFFDRLFSGKVRWAMHTGMTCDLAFVYALVKKQQGDDVRGTGKIDCAFFYDVKHPVTCKVHNSNINFGELKKYTHALDCGQTHHAKISLVCCEEGKVLKYRLAVYSRNLEFSRSIDSALLFDLEFPDGETESGHNGETESGKQLCRYLRKLVSSVVDEEGKSWLQDHLKVFCDGKLRSIKLKSEFEIGSSKKYADIFFGGCGDTNSLGDRLALHNVTNESIVLTPPEFLKNTSAATFFSQTKQILFDHNNMPSHVKLYLLEKPKEPNTKEKQYELWTGSANASVHGIGWDFQNNPKSSNSASVECLVRFKIEKEETFGEIKKDIENDYARFTDFSVDGSLCVEPDEFGPFIVNNFVCDGIKLDEENKCIEYTLKKITDNKLEKIIDKVCTLRNEKVSWRPLEYSETGDDSFCSFCMKKDSSLTLKYNYNKFQKTQGILVFGTSCCIMDVSDKVPVNLPRVKTKIVKDTRLTEWLLDPANIPEKNDKWDSELKWCYDALHGTKAFTAEKNAAGNPNSSAPVKYTCTLPPLSSAPQKSMPMDFQKKGANCLYDILKKNSRAFLADEPGLGKTFTSAMLIDKMADDHFGNCKNPMYVIYVAPNLAIIEKNVEELVDKYKDLNGSTSNKSNKTIIRVNGNSLTQAFSELKKYAKTIKENKKSNKYIFLIGISAEIALRPDFGTDDERNKKDELLNQLIGNTKFKTTDCPNADYTKLFLKKHSVKLVIWDEFHRYVTKFNTERFGSGTNAEIFFAVDYPLNPFFAYECESDMKTLFVSATPYKTNISGKENKDAVNDLYQKKLDDESPDVNLPSFSEFADLFCGGKPNNDLTIDDLRNAYENRNQDITKLEKLLKKRMIRNERTRLQGDYEEHIAVYERDDQYDGIHAQILKNTARQCRLLKRAGYPEGSLRWSLSLPWILCFSTKRTAARCEKTKVDIYFDCLKPKNGNNDGVSKRLFLYNKTGKPNQKLLTKLPQQNLAMYQICEKNLMDRRMAQLLWVPATMPQYKAGEKSIFTEFADYSKLLVFAEYRYLQRGGSILLSDYARLKCNTNNPVPGGRFEIQKKEIPLNEDFLYGDYRNLTLDELLRNKEEIDNVSSKLYRLASPAACAKRLRLDPERMTKAFNEYFNSSGVKEALWSWICDNGYQDKIEEGILRYCAEGNLCAVLEEWLFCMKAKTPDERMNYIESILNRTHSTVGVQTLQTTKNETNGKQRMNGFAEQLTGDISDVGSGENEAATNDCCNSFNSPFYPMILFAGRGAQEGIDMHNYCLRIMHLTLPRGAVSYEQRNGRIDRYRSLLVRRRAAEIVEIVKNENLQNDSKDLIARVFQLLEDKKEDYKENKLFPNWSIPNNDSKWHFEELMPVWEYTEESCFADSMREMLRVYRESMGVLDSSDKDHINLSTM